MVAMRQARSSKGVARGPAEWGEVLFEPTWAKSRRFYDRGNLWMSICLLAMAVAMVFFLPISVPGFNAVDLMMIGIGTVVLLMGYSMLKQAATMMPFRIYSRGFTSVKVRLVQGLQRREELVGFDRLKTVRVKAFESPSYTLSVLQLVYVDEEGNEQVMNLDFEDPDTPLDVMMTFSTMVPEKTDKSVLSCLLPVVKESGSEVTQKRGVLSVVMSNLMEYLILLMTLLFSMLFGGITGQNSFNLRFIAFGMPFLIGMVVIFISMLVWGMRLNAIRYFQANARLDGQTITVPARPLFHLLLDVRSMIPLDEVLEVRHVLTPSMNQWIADLILTNGDRHIIPIEIFHALESHPDFEARNVSMVNKKPSPRPGPSIVRANPVKILIYFLANVGITFGWALFVKRTGLNLADEYMASSSSVMTVIMTIASTMMVIVMFIGAKKAKRAELEKNVIVAEDGLILSTPVKGENTISRASIKQITIDGDYIGTYIGVRHDRGELRLPISMAERFIERNLRLEDTRGVLPQHLKSRTTVEGAAMNVATSDASASGEKAGKKAFALPLLPAIPAIVAGLGIGWAVDRVFSTSTSGSKWPIILQIGMASALVLYILIQWAMMRSDFLGRFKEKVDMRGVAVAVATIVLIATASQLAWGVRPWMPEVEIFDEPAPMTSALPTGIYDGQVLETDGPVSVRAKETLKLTNCTLRIGPRPDGRTILWVGAGGELVLKNTTVEPKETGPGLSIEVHGSALIVDCILAHLYSDPDHLNGEGGLEVYSDDVRIYGTTIEDCQGNGLMSVYCSPQLEDCIIRDVRDDGLEAHAGTPVLRNCTMENCEWPAILWESDACFLNCTFRNCTNSIALMWSSPTFDRCSFVNFYGAAIKRTTRCSPTITHAVYNNTYHRADVENPATLPSIVISSITYNSLLIGSLVFLGLNESRKETKPSKKDTD